MKKSASLEDRVSIIEAHIGLKKDPAPVHHREKIVCNGWTVSQLAKRLEEYPKTAKVTVVDPEIGSNYLRVEWSTPS